MRAGAVELVVMLGAQGPLGKMVIPVSVIPKPMISLTPVAIAIDLLNKLVA
jgi:hypothetical protein